DVRDDFGEVARVELVERAVVRRDRVEEREGRLTVAVVRRRLGVDDEGERATRSGLLAGGRRCLRAAPGGLRRACGEREREGQRECGDATVCDHEDHPLGADSSARPSYG